MYISLGLRPRNENLLDFANIVLNLKFKPF